jgi:hypothetical protein
MQVSVQDAQATQIVVLVIAMAIVAFWRTVIKWLVLLAATVIIATLGYGLIAFWQNTRHIAG